MGKDWSCPHKLKWIKSRPGHLLYFDTTIRWGFHELSVGVDVKLNSTKLYQVNIIFFHLVRSKGGQVVSTMDLKRKAVAS